jgi:rhodanese-related sulfurtransferase/DNA-directed RNA polymerase subunit RPC12/RpoP
MLSKLLLVLLLNSFLSPQADKYQCLPCGRDCDKKIYTKAGSCPGCHMTLVKSHTVVLKEIPASEICNYISTHPATILLDVRTREEFEGKADPNFGSLRNAINIPIQELDNRMQELEKYKGREVLVYCSHSHRSPQAGYKLSQNGFSRVVNMSGGMSELKNGPCKK